MDLLSEEECLSALRRALEGKNFRLERFSLESVSESPIGYMARHLSLVVIVRTNGRTREIRFFAKSPPASGSHLVYLEEMQHFQKELDMYESVVPVMSAALPEGMQLPIPQCYLTRGKATVGSAMLEPNGRPAAELIILEDLKEKGFRLWDKMVPFDLGHCRTLMRSLALFHAPSFLLQSTEAGDGFDYNAGTFRVARDRLLVGTGGVMGKLWADSSVDTLSTAVTGLWPERYGGREGRRELRKRLREAWGELSELAKPSKTRTNVLCHGDLWANNVMFRYEGGDGVEPADAVLIDLQLVRIAPAATDILLFLHTSTTRRFREEHMSDLLGTYHGHLSEIVGEASLGKLMSLESLQDCMEEYALFGKLVAAVWLSFILNSEEVVPMMDEEGSAGEPPDFVAKILKDRGDEVLMNIEASEVFKTRIKESYRECLEHVGLWK